MCCRYYLERTDTSLLQYADAAAHSPLLDRFQRTLSKTLLSAGEVYPDSVVPVIATSKSGAQACFPMQWGFHMKNRPLLMNARAETASEKPMFQEAWHAHRCVVPASWYYEWEHFLRPNGKKETGSRYLIQPKDEQLTWLCGLYRMEEGLPRFVILTRAPSDSVSFLHDRMPLMLRKQDAFQWISPDTRPEEIAFRAVTDLHLEKEEGS